MKIGITERGDAGVDLSWKNRLSNADGVILITKNVAATGFREAIKRCQVPFILHCTCTGMGGTEWEPNVPHRLDQLMALKGLIEDGVVDKRNVVIRIDPINPYHISFFHDVMEGMQICFADWTDFRYRVSVMDYYPHVRERLMGLGLPCSPTFQASDEMLGQIKCAIEMWREVTFESCAEPRLNARNLIHTGCVGWEDIRRMGLDESAVKEDFNPQNRYGCSCLSCKAELLTSKHQCQHRCAYCYWK